MPLTNKNTNIHLGISFSITEVIFTMTIASFSKLIAGELSVLMLLFF